VHFLLQVDMKGALTKRLDSIGADLRTCCATRTSAMAASREGQTVRHPLPRPAETANKARGLRTDSQPDLLLVERAAPTSSWSPRSSRGVKKRIQEFALKQNITTLHNRINELALPSR
jgi:preprotein translocase subunit SecD